MTRSKARLQVLIIVLLGVLTAWFLGAAGTSASVVDVVYTLLVSRVPVIGGPPVTQSFIATAPTVAPTAVVILLAGGTGEIQLTAYGSDGTLDVNSSNFLVRSRWLFAGHNLYVITPDAATDFYRLSGGLTDEQGSTAHVTDILQLIAWARSTVPGVPVWVVGTSRGTGGAFAASLYSPGAGGPDGLVFASPLTASGDPDSVLTANLSAITVPTLVINNTDDMCVGTLPSTDPAVKAALTSAPKVSIEMVTGDSLTPLTDQCNALSPHGFFGIEPRTVEKIANWINTYRRTVMAG
jgi:predicted alpha/beta-hydrolase family hydrolase